MANLAGVGSRIVAVIVDHIILAVISFALAMPFGLINYSAASMMNPLAAIGAMAGYSVISVAIFLLYFTYFEGTSGQTLGKRLVSIKVVKENGKKMTYADAFIRSILRIVDGIAAYLIGFIVVLASEKKQRVGDMAAGTLVVKA